jgi:uncharacterized protein
MNTIDNKLIEHVTETIVQKFHPRRVVLFGSYARGDAGPDSDLDIMIEMESELPPFQRAVAVSRAFSSRDWAMDILVYTPEEIRRLRQQFGSFVNIIEAEGKPLYVQAGITG